MDIEQSRFYFLFGCIPVRMLLAFSLLMIPNSLVTFVASVLASIGVSFATLYTLKLRMNASEGGGKTWWHYLRPLHAVSYLVAAYLLLMGNRQHASMILILDLFIGTFAWHKNSVRLKSDLFYILDK